MPNKFNFFPDPNIQEYLNNIIIHNNDNIYVKEYFSPSPKSMSFQSSSLDDQISEGNANEDLFTTADYNSVNNANLLKDIESLIQNMERKQTQDNDSTMLRNIDNILSNIKLNESRPHSPQSNLSAEPIRMKSPIMLPNRSDDKIKNDVPNIIDEIRNFVSNNIQEIVPDLVSQVEQELTTDLHDENYDIAMANLDEFLRSRHETDFEDVNIINVDSSFEDFLRDRHDADFEDDNNINESSLEDFLRDRHDAEFEEGKANDDVHELSFEDFLRDRHDEEFNELNVSPVGQRSLHSDDGDSVDIHDYFRIRHDEEYLERNDVQAASHDSITAASRESYGESYNNQIVAASASTKENDSSEDDESIVNNPQEVDVESFANEILETEASGADTSSQQLESLKYKSSYNLKILKQPSKRTRSEREFKKRNSLILENVLLGKTTSKSSARPKLSANESALHIKQDSIAASSSMPNDPENNINHPGSLINENIERESEQNLNEINVSDSERNVGNGESAVDEINGNVQANEQNESLLPLENVPTEIQVIETATGAVEGVVTNDATQNVINDGGAHENVTGGSHQRVNNDGSQSFAQTSSNAAMPMESDPSKAPQNLSELVEDTQRLIKQMKDEINAIYVSDDELSSSEGTEYSEEWADEYDGEEYTDEESEYEDWSGEFVESERTETAPDEIFVEEAFVDDLKDLNVGGDSANNIEIPEIRIIGDAPNAVNEMENAEAESVVHGKLELAPMSANQFKVDANIESENDSAGGSLNDNDDNLNNSTSLLVQEANEEALAQASSSQAPSANNEIINNEIKEATNSIKEIVNEAINDVISAISFDGAGDNVSPGSDDNDPQIAGGSLQPGERDTTNIDSAMNNSENTSAEVKPKVFDSDDDSITSGNVLNDDGNAEAIIFVSAEAASNAENEKLPPLSDSDQLKNDVGESREHVESGESSKPLTIDLTDNRVDESVDERPASTSLRIEAPVDNAEINEVLIFNVLDQVSNEANEINQISIPNVETNPISIEIEANAEVNKISAEGQAEGSSDKAKGAIAKSKIPAKIKTAKKKKEADDDSIKLSPTAKSKSSSPENIKGPLKTQDSTEVKIIQENNPKLAQTNRKDSTESTRKTSFDGGSRKKSLSAPFGFLVSSNVKNLQKEFLNKSNVPAPSKAQPTKVKPCKLTTPKSLMKEPAPTFANKLTKLITPSTGGKSNSEKSNHAENQKENQQRDHSKDVLPEKKYLEHCFSDEYPTTDDEEEEERKAPKSFFNKKPATQDSDDETSDVRRILKNFRHVRCGLVRW